MSILPPWPVTELRAACDAWHGAKERFSAARECAMDRAPAAGRLLSNALSLPMAGFPVLTTSAIYAGSSSLVNIHAVSTA